MPNYHDVGMIGRPTCRNMDIVNRVKLTFCY